MIEESRALFSSERYIRHGAVVGTILEMIFLSITLLFFLGIAKKWVLTKIPQNGLLSDVDGDKTGHTRGGRLNILFLGIDSVEGTHRTDTIFLLGISPQERKVSVLSIPRDTRVVIGGNGRKINEVLPRYGEYVLRSMIENLMEIRINRTVKVDFQGFVNIIDIMGGVDLEIEHPMNYDDNWGNVHIHFDKGLAHLDGRKSLEFVRFRADANADLGRIKRQQKFLSSVLTKLQTPAIMVRLPMIVAEGLRFVETDVSLAEALETVTGMQSGDSNLREGGISSSPPLMGHSGKSVNIQTMSLPGDARYIDKISFFMPLKDQAIALGAKHFSNLVILEFDANFTPVVSSGAASLSSPSISTPATVTPLEIMASPTVSKSSPGAANP